VHDLLEDRDRVVGQRTFRGTKREPFFALAASGREFGHPIIAVDRVEGGRIAVDWHLFRALGLRQEPIPEIQELIASARIEGAGGQLPSTKRSGNDAGVQ
jgi:hypothetical protein